MKISTLRNRVVWMVAAAAALGAGHAHVRVAASSHEPAAARPGPTAITPSFYVNAGQFPQPVRFAAIVADGRLFLTDDGAVAVTVDAERRPHRLSWRLAGGGRRTPVAEHQPVGVGNFFVGARSSWRSGVAAYNRVRYDDVVRGVNLVYYGQPDGVEFDLEVAPGTSAEGLRIAVDGAESLAVDPDGSLVLGWGSGELRWRAPVAYQLAGDARQPVAARYVVRDRSTVGFVLGDYDRSRQLIIDPVLMMSTLIGGSLGDSASDVAVSEQGLTYVVGSTTSLDFEMTQYSWDGTHAAGSDAYIVRYTPSNNFLAATFLGGGGNDGATGIAFDGADDVYVTGSTTSTDFPTLNALDSTYAATQCPLGPFPLPCNDAFIAKLNPALDTLLYSTYYGGSGDDVAAGIDVNEAGEAHVVGTTTSADLPVPNAFDASYEPASCGAEGLSRACPDLFVAKLATSGSALVFATYLGGGFDENAGDIVVDNQGRATIVGASNSSNFPTVSALQGARAPGTCGITPAAFICFDAIVARFSPLGLVDFSTYFGDDGDDRATDVTLDVEGFIWFTGHTTSDDFPVVNPLLAERAGPPDSSCVPHGSTSDLRCADAFVTKLPPAADTVLFSTYLGGARRDEARAITIDNGGRIAIAGHTRSEDFPIADAWQSAYAPSFGCPLPSTACSDAFVTMLKQDLSDLAYSTYLGWVGDDVAEALAIATDGALIVSGSTGNVFPVTPFAPRRHATGSEAFMAHFAAPPAAGLLATVAGTGIFGAPISTVAPALRTSFGTLFGVTVANGARYVVDAHNHRVMLIDAANQITTVAGNGTQGAGGDFGPATAAQLNSPSAVAVDAAGNLYIADSGNHKVRMVTAGGIILTIAGTGVAGFSGDAGPGTSAQLNSPMDLVVWNDFLVVADTGNSRIRMISEDGSIVTLVGTGTVGIGGDGGLGQFAELALPTGIAIEPSGALWIADWGAHRVRRVAGGIINTVAGTGVPGSTGDGGPATEATLAGPFGIDLSPAGKVAVVELFGHRVREIATDGTIATIAGNGGSGTMNIPPVAGVDSTLYFPANAAYDGLGNLLITDLGNFRLAILRGP
jgi:hypothetical protein